MGVNIRREGKSLKSPLNHQSIHQALHLNVICSLTAEAIRRPRDPIRPAYDRSHQAGERCSNPVTAKQTFPDAYRHSAH